MKKTNNLYLYPILETEIKKRHIKKREIAEKLSIQPRTLSKKLNGERKFLLEDAIEIHRIWFNDIPIEKLFQKI